MSDVFKILLPSKSFIGVNFFIVYKVETLLSLAYTLGFCFVDKKGYSLVT